MSLFPSLLLVLLSLALISASPTHNLPSHPHRIHGLPMAPGATPYSSPMYAGLVPVRNLSIFPSHNSTASLFYWLLEAEHPPKPDAPLVIWLQGGPGSTSMLGLFQELGPFKITDHGLERRDIAWTKEYDLLFIDSPIGTGFSQVPDLRQDTQRAANMSECVEAEEAAARVPHHYLGRQIPLSSHSAPRSCQASWDTAASHLCADQDCVSADLLTFLRAFYALHPRLAHRDLYITGESYGGKYVPSFASAIVDHNLRNGSRPSHNATIPLKGIAIGNGLTDPASQVLSHPVQALALGLINEAQAQIIDDYVRNSSRLALQGQWRASIDARLRMFDLVSDYSGHINQYDVRRLNHPNDWRPMRAWLSRPDVQAALNIPDFGSFENTPLVAKALLGDIMKSTAPLFPRLLQHLRVLLYQGNYDFRDGVAGNSPWISRIDWPGRDAFNTAPRSIWSHAGTTLGTIQDHGPLRRVIILNAGHLVPMDQPDAARIMISSWISHST